MDHTPLITTTWRCTSCGQRATDEGEPGINERRWCTRRMRREEWSLDPGPEAEVRCNGEMVAEEGHARLYPRLADEGEGLTAGEGLAQALAWFRDMEARGLMAPVQYEPTPLLLVRNSADVDAVVAVQELITWVQAVAALAPLEA